MVADALDRFFREVARLAVASGVPRLVVAGSDASGQLWIGGVSAKLMRLA